MEKATWMIVDTNGGVLVEECAYTDDEINSYVCRYENLGYRVVRHIVSPVNVIEMELADSDSSRKEKILIAVDSLDNKEKALLLAYLSRRIQKVDLPAIWFDYKLRYIYEEIHRIYRGTKAFKEILIAYLRQTA